MFQVTNFEDQAHVRVQRNALVGRQGQNLVVVHDAVHRFDPVGIEVTVQ